MARQQHYYFAHRLLPQIVLSDPAEALERLTAPDAGERLRAMWRAVGESFEGLDPGGLAVRAISGTFVVIEMPEPQEPPEALFVAVHHDGSRTRYFALERGASLEGGATAVLCEWSPEGEGLSHLNYGELPDGSEPTFLEAVRRLVQE